MKLTFLREQLSQKYKNIHTQSICDLQALENIEAGVFPSCLGAKATQIINWINTDYTSKTNTDLYTHRTINDLIYALQYFYGVKFIEYEYSLITEELTIEEFRLLVEYSEFLFQKHHFGLTNEEFEDIHYREQLEAEAYRFEQMELEQLEAIFFD
ncbi:hypothetical protein HN020_14855 [Brevibacillus borstelensis]|uniref:hypothetical protein n=1 Tax=Brevibacillus borstelensis TaxID=45462 RepID=UPI00046A261B|nr:hypothetical protein [Brevibacillus borstelensis]MCC0567423.1 hypothetical protein [Brevibacillus borstelensis]MCM3561559.1 hypothetical protein [Brevibacillus borstelensis]MCM3593970.1 hypothetical protein [Brevibacillus borstelensis]NOU56023.1 hypothetical protein [Brevibacillus borstelensis]